MKGSTNAPGIHLPPGEFLDGALGQLLPIQIGRIPLHHGGRAVVGREHRHQITLGQRLDESGGADDEHGRSRWQQVAQVVRGGVQPLVKLRGSNVSWDVSAEYAVNQDINLYARVATGFRAPSIQGCALSHATVAFDVW